MNPANNVFDFPDVSLVCPKIETPDTPEYPSNSPPLGTIQQFDPPLNLVPQLARRWSCGDSQHAADELPASYYHNLGFALHNHIQMSNQRYLSEFNCPSTVSPIPSAHDSRQLAPLQQPPYDHLGIQEQHLFSSHAYGNSMMPDGSYFDNGSRSISAPTLGNSGHNSTMLSNSQSCAGRRRFRTNFTEHQSMFLEDSFKESHYPDHKAKRHMADYLNIPEDRITVWFQNRRAKWRRKEHRQKDRNKNETFANNVTTFDYPCFSGPNQDVLDIKLPPNYPNDQVPLNQFQVSPTEVNNSGQFLHNLDQR